MLIVCIKIFHLFVLCANFVQFALFTSNYSAFPGYHVGKRVVLRTIYMARNCLIETISITFLRWLGDNAWSILFDGAQSFIYAKYQMTMLHGTPEVSKSRIFFIGIFRGRVRNLHNIDNNGFSCPSKIIYFTSSLVG